MGKKRRKDPKRQKAGKEDLLTVTKALQRFFEGNSTKQFTFGQVYKRLRMEVPKDVVFQALEKMERQGLVRENEHGRFMSSQQKQKHTPGKTIQGVVDLNQSGNAYIISTETDQDIFVPRGALNRAFDGDRVQVAITRQGKFRPEGEITQIIDRSRHDIVGVVQLMGDYAFVLPDKRKVPVDIFIPPGKVGQVRDGDRVIVRITAWPEGKRNPEGIILERLGALGVNDVEMKTILVENGFPLEFSDAVKREVNDLTFDITEEEISRRRDCRSITTFTIDPEDAKDFDDALSLQRLQNGNWEVGVHIADVSHYVVPGTQLDKEAFQRGTSVYLVDRVLPMLPEELSNIVCSLRPHEDKLTFSAIFEITPDGEVVDRWFGRTIIRSDHRFTYEQAQAIIEGGEGPFRTEVLTLNELSLHLRKKKFANGAIAFETVEVKFKIDLNGVPLGVYVKERKEAHMLIEDFMLLANKEVAMYAARSKRQNKHVPFVYRIHDQPDMQRLIDFSRFAAGFGYQIQFDTPRQTADSLNRLMKEIDGKPEQNVLEQLAIRSMAKAVYSTHNIGHYGLAFDHYTHFTSPIRRYPDVMAHRILAALLTDESAFVPYEKLEDKCVRCSWMERKAMDAERESVKYKQAEFMQGQVGNVFEGIISGVQQYGLFVEIKENKCEGLADIDSLLNDYYLYYERENALVGRNTGKKYRLGDDVRVRVVKVDLGRRRIDFEVVE